MADGRAKRRILWAEDSEPIFEANKVILSSHLSDQGIDAEIERARDGNEVFRLLSSSEYNLIILDLQMHGYNGIQTIEWMSKFFPGRRQIVVSSHLTDPEFRDALERLQRAKLILGSYETAAQSEWCKAVYEELRVEPLNILHLSDIHFGSFHAFRTGFWMDFLRDQLKKISKNLTINCVVLSGDLTSTCLDTEFEEATTFIRALQDLLHLVPAQFVIVPGNHDIERGAEPKRRFAKYVEFLNNLFPKDATEFRKRYPVLHKQRRLTWDYQANKPKDLFCVAVFEESATTVVGFNSVHAGEGIDPEDFDKSEIAPQQLLATREALPDDDHLRIAVFHHHLFPVADLLGAEDRILSNQGLVLRHLIETNFSLVLHGHTHYPAGHSYRPLMSYNAPSGRPIHVFSTGTASAKHLALAAAHFHFNVIECRRQGIRVSPYRLNIDAASWKADPPIVIDWNT